MACPFSQHRSADVLQRQPTINNDLELPEVSGDSLTLTHLNAAMQLLTAPSNDDIHQALISLKQKYSGRFPGLRKFGGDRANISTYPHYDYLADIQDSLMEFDEATAIDILILLGEELVNTSCHGIIEKAFRCLGGNLPELIASLDGVYDVLKLQEEDLTDTGFVCASENELIFTSDRIAVAYLLLGILQNISKKLYQTECTIQMEPLEGSVQRFHYLFKIEESIKEQPEIIPRSISSDPNDLQMTNSTFCKMFPWHFIMDENLELLQIGEAFSKLFKNYLNATKAATHYFKFRRPVGLKLEFNEIIKRTNTPFLITLRAPAGRQDFVAKGLEIKGQMVFCPGPRNTLLFVGSPFLDGLEGLTCNGLFLSDIPLYDATREVILVGEQARAQDGLKRRMDKLKKEVEEGHEAVSKERKKNVSLLQMIFPDEIAEKLWLGKQVDAQSFPEVTMLFSDIVGFTSICSSASPFQVISMLESLYKVFDELCGVFDVYKVETIGDAYCVAKGLEGRSATSQYDAHKVAFMAMKMIENCAKHVTHDGKHIQMRIGLHTGTVLAGVVGRKMPRYCLFGHNVTIANKFESGSEASRINISPTTKKWLTKIDDFKFEYTRRDPSFLPKEYQAKDGETCYFLDGYKHAGVDENLDIQIHIDAAMQQINHELEY
ncbi:CLUMA_CG005307, isoform A [Clunio marinus]|uniref:guanylate cyclase n=1 Tax=Clunio marinus TaxID=568069 RepID=A0A1J1HZU9_9DIPT|nr:CLUMA_CG005307, isoform A [Clunio marinus]